MDAHDHFDGPWWRYPVLRNALVAGLLTGLGFALSHLGVVAERTERLFYFGAIPLGAFHWAREALEALVRERDVGIDLLMLAAASGSALLGLWDEAAFLVVLYGSAEGLEEYTYARTRSAIRSLLDLAPKEARLLRDGREETVPADALTPGDRFLVRPGESIATDGVVRIGMSSIDESSITGESVPVDKGPGAAVFAGTLNRQGALEIEATAPFADNTLSKIIHLVETAQEQKGAAQQWIDRFGRRYSPAVLAAAALIAVVPWAIGLPPLAWAYRAVVLLVAAAPCALVMSMPVAMAAGIGHAGRHGILIKGGAHLEHLGSVRTIAFDKTGTLTEGRPALVDVIPLEGVDGARVLALVGGIERFSEHPLARAIVDEATRRGIVLAEATEFEALPGAGASARIDGAAWLLGKPSLFADRGVPLDTIAEQLATLEADGKTVVLLGAVDGVKAIFALQDMIRADAPAAIRELQHEGAHIVLLSGDNQRTADAVAKQVGIHEAWGNLTPEGKVRAIGALEGRFGAGTLMIGDGVNDAPALAAATCGMAMGVAGSDAAIEAADVALMADDLGKVVAALRLGKRVQRISRQNIVFSITVLAVLVPAAVSGVLGITLAVVAHELSELVAVANGLRVTRLFGTRALRVALAVVCVVLSSSVAAAQSFVTALPVTDIRSRRAQSDATARDARPDGREHAAIQRCGCSRTRNMSPNSVRSPTRTLGASGDDPGRGQAVVLLGSWEGVNAIVPQNEIHMDPGPAFEALEHDGPRLVMLSHPREWRGGDHGHR